MKGTCTGFELDKSEGKRLLRRPRHGWKHNIKICLKEIGVGT
jgi:hypothetical protein